MGQLDFHFWQNHAESHVRRILQAMCLFYRATGVPGHLEGHSQRERAAVPD